MSFCVVFGGKGKGGGSSIVMECYVEWVLFVFGCLFGLVVWFCC